MVFSSNIFLLYFMPTFFLVYFLTPRKARNYVLLLASLIFYAWGAPEFIIQLVASTVANFFLVRWMCKTDKKGLKKLLCALSIIIPLGLLIFYKYGNFTMENLNAILGLTGHAPLTWKRIMLPIGISFFSFQSVTYTLDTYRGVNKPMEKLTDFVLYITMFPQLIAGPIIRYCDVADQIRSRESTMDDRLHGFYRFVIGLAKYVILAPAFGRIATAGLEHKDTTLAGSWIGMLAYFGECWFTFTALCDMAKGIGLLAGFDYEENYRDLSVKDMLTGFVKSANTTLIKLFEDFFGMFTKGNDFFAAVCTLIGCVLIALWYKIGYPFLAAGIALGAVLMIERLIPENAKKKIPTAVKALYVFLLATVILGAIRFSGLDEYKNWLLSLFGSGNEYILTKALKKVLLENLYLVIIGFCCVCVPVKSLLKKGVRGIEEGSSQGMGIMRVGRTAALAVMLLMSVITLAAQKVG